MFRGATITPRRATSHLLCLTALGGRVALNSAGAGPRRTRRISLLHRYLAEVALEVAVPPVLRRHLQLARPV